jgi:hypothetical protein
VFEPHWITIHRARARCTREARSRPLAQRSFCSPPRTLSSGLVLAQQEQAHPWASSLSLYARSATYRAANLACYTTLAAANQAVAGRMPAQGSG